MECQAGLTVQIVFEEEHMFTKRVKSISIKPTVTQPGESDTQSLSMRD